ncbi:FKBP-type peptidyl-prolyl cis-trans isomerase [Georgenia faecalis]|uniref:FKBP-type peptidyl-prolyl cis-trans isomerase n=1 Tax=Georgenia faecalis TaxID=2483799 RepID=UPI000FDA124E|nr:FKBP-type peptidyl-prolyl cis-trans isomerase [Georgenia faecalis]
MRRSATSVAATALATVLLLAACGSSDSGDAGETGSPSSTASEAATASEADLAALEGITVEGEPGAEPTVTFEAPLTVSGAVATVVAEGDGAELEDGQVLSLHFVTVSGADGSTVSSTYESTPQSLTLGDEGIVPALTEALQGQKVGARLIFAAPDTEAAAVMVIDVIDAVTVPERAEGTAVEPAEGLPTVTLADNGAPSIEVVDGEPPAELVVQPLIEGDGPVVESGQTVTMQYTGWLWDGTEFDSSWANGAPFTTAIGTGAVIEGWDTGLVGQKVGSQVMLVIPPALGYGDTDNGPIPAGSTLVFVVDILHAA